MTVKQDSFHSKESVHKSRKPIIMVSSTVDGIEDLLEQIFAILSAEFTVRMSYNLNQQTAKTQLFNTLTQFCCIQWVLLSFPSFSHCRDEIVSGNIN